MSDENKTTPEATTATPAVTDANQAEKKAEDTTTATA